MYASDDVPGIVTTVKRVREPFFPSEMCRSPSDTYVYKRRSVQLTCLHVSQKAFPLIRDNESGSSSSRRPLDDDNDERTTRRTGVLTLLFLNWSAVVSVRSLGELLVIVVEPGSVVGGRNLEDREPKAPGRIHRLCQDWKEDGSPYPPEVQYGASVLASLLLIPEPYSRSRQDVGDAIRDHENAPPVT